MKTKELEEILLKKLQKAYTEYNIRHIEDVLSKDVTYDSIWVLSQITNKTEYLDYLKSKLLAMKNSEIKMKFQIMYELKNARPHLVILSPVNKEGVHGCFTIETEKDLIKAIHLTPFDFYEPLKS